MKAICMMENFKKGILTAEKIIGRNLSLPILSNILIETEKGRLKVSATNLEIGVVCLIRAKVEKEGKIAVPGKILNSFLNNVGDADKIEMETSDSILNLICEGNKTAIKGMDAKDFPLIPKAQAEPLFELDGVDFQEKVAKVLPCVALTETRQELTGVFISFSEDKLNLAATDSFRLSESIIKLKKDNTSQNYKRYIEKNNSVIIPAKTLSEVIRSINQTDEKIKVFLGESQIFFSVDDIIFVSRLIDGKYPEYKQVIPKSFESNMLIEREVFLKAVKLASIFADSKSREVKIRIGEKKQSIIIEAQSVEAGENSTEINCEINTKEKCTIAFNSRYLVDGIGSISTKNVYVGFNDSFGPVVLRGVDDEKKTMDDYLHIVMPIRS